MDGSVSHGHAIRRGEGSYTPIFASPEYAKKRPYLMPADLNAFGADGSVTISLPRPTLRERWPRLALRVMRVGSIGGIG